MKNMFALFVVMSALLVGCEPSNPKSVASTSSEVTNSQSTSTEVTSCQSCEHSEVSEPAAQ